MGQRQSCGCVRVHRLHPRQPTTTPTSSCTHGWLSVQRSCGRGLGGCEGRQRDGFERFG